jgi:SAM-dependent methyltransferase
VDVRRHDVQGDDFEQSTYDLVHCRAFLGHLQQPETALQRMATALKPGGWLFVEEADFGTFSAADLAHPSSANFNRISRIIIDAWHVSGVVHSYLGRGIRKPFDQMGLVNVQHDGTMRIEYGGEDGAQFILLGFTDVMRDSLLAAGVLTEADLTELNRLFQDPSFSFVQFTMFAAWGQRA